MNQTLIFDYKNIGFRTDDLEEFLRNRKINISLPRCRDITDLGLKDAFGFLDHHPGAKEKAAALWEPVTIIVSQAEEWTDFDGPQVLSDDAQKVTTQQAAELTVLRVKLQEAEAALKAAEELAARLVREREEDLVQGKSKSLMLRVIGGLAMSGHGSVIHSARLDCVTGLLDELARVGVETNEKTLRLYLKEAAALIKQE